MLLEFLTLHDGASQTISVRQAAGVGMEIQGTYLPGQQEQPTSPTHSTWHCPPPPGFSLATGS